MIRRDVDRGQDINQVPLSAEELAETEEIIAAEASQPPPHHDSASVSLEKTVKELAQTTQSLQAILAYQNETGYWQDYYWQLASDYAYLDEQFQRLQNQVATNTVGKYTANFIEQRIYEQAASLKQENNNLTNQIGKVGSELEKLHQSLEKVKQQKEKYLSEIRNLKNHNDQLQTKIHTLTHDNIVLKTKDKKNHESIDRLTVENKIARGDISQLVSEKKQETAIFNTTIDRKNHELERLEQRYQIILNENKLLLQKVLHQTETIRGQQQQISQSSHQYEQSQQELELLTLQLEKLQHNTSVLQSQDQQQDVPDDSPNISTEQLLLLATQERRQRDNNGNQKIEQKVILKVDAEEKQSRPRALTAQNYNASSAPKQTLLSQSGHFFKDKEQKLTKSRQDKKKSRIKLNSSNQAKAKKIENTKKDEDFLESFYQQALEKKEALQVNKIPLLESKDHSLAGKEKIKSKIERLTREDFYQKTIIMAKKLAKEAAGTSYQRVDFSIKLNMFVGSFLYLKVLSPISELITMEHDLLRDHKDYLNPTCLLKFTMMTPCIEDFLKETQIMQMQDKLLTDEELLIFKSAQEVLLRVKTERQSVDYKFKALFLSFSNLKSLNDTSPYHIPSIYLLGLISKEIAKQNQDKNDIKLANLWYKTASDYFSDCYNKSPWSGATYFQLGLCSKEVGNYLNAYAYFRYAGMFPQTLMDSDISSEMIQQELISVFPRIERGVQARENSDLVLLTGAKP